MRKKREHICRAHAQEIRQAVRKRWNAGSLLIHFPIRGAESSDGRQALLSANRRTFGSVCQCQRLAIANCNATQRREGPSQQARMAHPDACHLSTASILLRVLPACVPLGGHALTLDRRRVTVSRSRTMSTCPGPASLRMPCRSSRGPGGALSLSLSVRCAAAGKIATRLSGNGN